MHVLVCDDDNATRFAVKRMLTQHLPCTISECADGVQALQMLGRERFSFILLDVEMPSMGGIEVLELLRESPATKDLPVIVLSNVRDDQVVRQLLKLGVADYILKPPRAEKLVPKIKRLVSILPKEKPAREQGLPRVSATHPGVVVDGNLDFRFVFASELQRYGAVLECDSGAAGLAAFRDSGARIVFVGRELGVVGPELLVRKLREARGSEDVRIIGLVDERTDASFRSLFDAVVPRTFNTQELHEALRPYVMVPGPMTALSIVVPDMADLVLGAAGQVFGMMLDADVATIEPQSSVVAAASAHVDLALEDRFVIRLGVHMGVVAATAVAARMTGADPSKVTDEDRATVAGEVSNLLMARLHASFSERSLKSEVSTPVLAGGGAVPPPADGEGILIGLAISGAGEFFVSLLARNRTPAETAQPAATGAAGAPEAAVPPAAPPASAPTPSAAPAPTAAA
jgi:CheY-like chemotaxis protein